MATYTMKQLSETSRVTARTIRYYIAQGLLPGAIGKGRRAHYGKEHLDRLVAIQAGLDGGKSLKELYPPSHGPSTLTISGPWGLNLRKYPSESWTHYQVAPGVVLALEASVSSKRLYGALKAFNKELKREQ